MAIYQRKGKLIIMNNTHLYPLQLLVQSHLDEPLSMLDVIECLKIAQVIAIKHPQVQQYSDVDEILRTFVFTIHTHFELPQFDGYNPVRNLQLRAVICCISNILEIVVDDNELLNPNTCIFEKTIQDLEHIYCETSDLDLDKNHIQKNKSLLAKLCPVYNFYNALNIKRYEK
jgi:hypothetical protein